MIIKTKQGATFDTEKKYRSSLMTHLVSGGIGNFHAPRPYTRKAYDTLTLTGETEVCTEFMEQCTELEVENQYGEKQFISEKDLIEL